MIKPHRYDSLQQILDELLTVGYFMNAHESNRLSEWLARAEKEWAPGPKQSETGGDLLRALWGYRFSWLNNPDGAGLFYVSAIDKCFGGLSDLWGEQCRRDLFETEGRPRRPFPMYAWYFDRFIRWFWESIRDEYNCGAWPDLRCTRLRPPSPVQFVWMVRRQRERQGLSQDGRRELTAVLTECRSLISIPDLATMVRELEAEIGDAEDASSEWLDWCRDVIGPFANEVDDGAIINADYLRPITINSGELSKLEAVIFDGLSWTPSNVAAASVKRWMSHLLSSRCEESAGTIVNYLITRIAVARGYQAASGELRLIRYRTPTGQFSMYIDAMERILRHTLKKPLIIEPEQFERFLRLLAVLNTLNTPQFESVAKICERHADSHGLTSPQLSRLATFFDQESHRDSDDLRKGIRVWNNLRERCE